MKSKNNNPRGSADFQRDNADAEKIEPMMPVGHSLSNPTVETPVQIRQGFIGRPVLVVLLEDSLS
jgi:hypothetical protein